jgi:hypothetical protein
MSVLNENQLIGASGAGGDYEIEQSLRFDDGRGSSLTRTPASASNRKTFTISFWIKRGVGGFENVIRAYSAGNDYDAIQFTNDNQIRYFGHEDSTNVTCTTNALYRDSSSWYHFLISVDTTQSTSSNRIKIYANGVLQTLGTATYPSQNEDLRFNSAVEHEFSEGSLDAYLAEFNFIDGQALTPDSFGETGDYGEWKPLKYTGAYGTNGFYLPFEQDYTVEGFSTVVYEGTSAAQYIGGTGFSPDMTWFKVRSTSGNHQLYDTVRGASSRLVPNATTTEATTSNGFAGWQADGFSLDGGGGGGDANTTARTYVAWNWDMGGTTASNTSGSITSSVRANTAYGQSIVSYTGTGSAATIGHGLASAPTMIIVKNRNSTTHWSVYHSSLGNTKFIDLNQTNASDTSTSVWNDTTPTSSVFSIGTNSRVTGSGNALIAYCFTSVTGYSKFGSYSGNGSSTGPVVTLGFSPAFVMIKRTDAATSWFIHDNVRDTSNPNTAILKPNSDSVEFNGTAVSVDFLSTGFQLKNTDESLNASGGTYIYAAFADTREYAYWYDQSGNNNDWTSEGGLTESDVMLDSPTNNFCTLNPIGGINSGIIFSEGNLQLTSSSGNWRSMTTTFSRNSGKWYLEVVKKTIGNGSFFGITTATNNNLFVDNNYVGKFVNDFGFRFSDYGTSTNSEGYSTNASFTSLGSAQLVVGDILQIAVDYDNNKIWFGRNGTYYSSGNPATGANAIAIAANTDYFVGVSTQQNDVNVLNFGQDSSFAGAKTPQGHSDEGGIGDFYYAPPSGFLSLCTKSLAEPDVIPSEHFNTVLYTGNATDRTINGVGFPPSFVWLKGRSGSGSHGLFDTVRGAAKRLASNSSNAEDTAAGVNSFESDGFVLDSANWNDSNVTYVAWNWKLGGSAVSNSNGSATSQVSANVDAGISIATFTLPTTAQTIGHGLSKPPELIFQKGRVSGSAWWTFAKPVGNTKALRLDGSGAAGTSTNFWNNTDPTSTVVTIGANSGGNNSWMMYCFHSVEGYSLVGSYVGNGSTDGVYVYCGFSPAVIITKSVGSGGWRIIDNKRTPFNPSTASLYPDDFTAEYTGSGHETDFTANGFKMRNSNGRLNTNGQEYVFYAIAESPFKHSNAR